MMTFGRCWAAAGWAHALSNTAATATIRARRNADMKTTSRGLQLFDLDVPPADLHRLFFFRLVNLQGDEALRRHVVFQVGGGHAIDPGLDRRAFALDAELVPLALLEGLAGLGVSLQVVQPAATFLVVNPAGPGPVRRIDLDLIAEHRIARHLPRLPVLNDFAFFLGVLAANLHARVHAGIDLELQLENEVAVVAVGAEKAVRRAEDRRADDGAVFDGVLGLAPPLHPAVERFAV